MDIYDTEDTGSKAAMPLTCPSLFRASMALFSEEDRKAADGHAVPVDILQLNNKCSHGIYP